MLNTARWQLPQREQCGMLNFSCILIDRILLITLTCTVHLYFLPVHVISPCLSRIRIVAHFKVTRWFCTYYSNKCPFGGSMFDGKYVFLYILGISEKWRYKNKSITARSRYPIRNSRGKLLMNFHNAAASLMLHIIEFCTLFSILYAFIHTVGYVAGILRTWYFIYSTYLYIMHGGLICIDWEYCETHLQYQRPI